jgi:hypothetical protein
LARDIDASNTRHLRFSLDLIVHAKRGRGAAKGAHYMNICPQVNRPAASYCAAR